jgi:hypothetical protein
METRQFQILLSIYFFELFFFKVFSLFNYRGIYGNISIQDFSFNQEFQPYNKYHIAEVI